MDHRSKKQQEKLSKWRRKRDLLYFFLLVWIIVLPEDGIISIPIGLVYFVFISWIEKKLHLK